MKAIMISIKPKWMAKILNGEKTIEIRKTMPKCDLPIDVYIYCTKEEELFDDYPNMANGRFKHNKVYIGKYNLSGKVVAKFTLNKVENIFYNDYYELFMSSYLQDDELCKKSCVSQKDMVDYFGTNGGNCGYAWYISNLEIFDKPKELSEFRYATCPQTNCEYCKYNKTVDGDLYCTRKRLTKAPQSWCYVEELK